MCEDEVASLLVEDPRVDTVILTGATDTARLFQRLRPGLRLLAETGGKNGYIVSALSDRELAIRDVVHSAFGHAGQKCSAASLVILVGTVSRSHRFRRQLVDAATSCRVGLPWQPATQVGPLIEPANGKLLRALTTLEPGQQWIVEPQRLDSSGALWKPGIRAGVAPG